jgi:hypothetical protein
MSFGARVPASTCRTCSTMGISTPFARASSRIGPTDASPSVVCCIWFTTSGSL